MEGKKSEDARFQLHIWSKLLEGRIALQKVIIASRELDELYKKEEITESQVSNENTVKPVKKLLSCLVRIRDTYRQKSQLCIENVEETNQEDNDNLYTNLDDDVLNAKHEEFTSIRDNIIEKWCEKTKIGTIPKKGYTALELPTLQLIKNSLKDKERLIRRTQLNRSSHIDNDFHPETFNDDDFYHQLLKEVISKEEGRKWVELQRTKYKIKRKADTKATKGRKIKKDLIRKLVNFMAPTVPVNHSKEEPMPDQIRDQLMKSLFGVRITR